MKTIKKALILLASYLLLVLSYFGVQWIKGQVEYSRRPYQSDIVEISNSLDKLYYSEPYVYQMFRGNLKVKNIRNSCGIFEYEKPHSLGFLRDTEEGTFSSYDGNTLSGYYYITFDEGDDNESYIGVIYQIKKDTDTIDWNKNYLTFYTSVQINAYDKISFSFNYFPNMHLLKLKSIDYKYRNESDIEKQDQSVWVYDEKQEKGKFNDYMTEEKFIEFYEEKQIEKVMTTQIDTLLENLNNCSTLSGEFEKVDWSSITIKGIREILE